MTVTYEGNNPTAQLLVLKQLKVVEIRCDKEHEVVRQIVKILSTFRVSYDKIDVQVIPHSKYTNFSSSKFVVSITSRDSCAYAIWILKFLDTYLHKVSKLLSNCICMIVEIFTRNYKSKCSHHIHINYPMQVSL